MARTTIDLDASVLEQLRTRARREGKSMGRVGSELLSRALSDSDPEPPQDFEWVVHRLGRPRVDLEDDEAVRRALGGDR